MNLKRQKTSIKNRKYTGGKKDTTYFTKKLNEFGLKVPKYLGNGNITQKQFKSLQNRLERNIDDKTKVQKAKNISQAQELNQKMEAQLLKGKAGQRKLDELVAALPS